MSTPSRSSSSQAQAERIRSLIERNPVGAGPRRAAPQRDIDDVASPNVAATNSLGPVASSAIEKAKPLLSIEDVLDAEALIPEPPSKLRRVLEFSRAHLEILIVFVVVVLGFTAFRLLGAAGHEVPVPSPVVSEPTTLPSQTPLETETIAVHVVGAVSSPGVIQIPAGSRIIDALEAAGGLLPDANIEDLNLAAPVPDGAQVIVGTEIEPRGEIRVGASGQPNQSEAPTDSGTSGSEKLNLNSANQADLEALPGVGPVMAGRIISWRTEHGKFSNIQELKEIDGVGAKTFERLAGLLEV